MTRARKIWQESGGYAQIRSSAAANGLKIHSAGTTVSKAVSEVGGNTKLLLHMTGANGSTTFKDSATGKTITAVGDAKISTAQYKFDGSSALFDGTSDYLTIQDSTDWNFGTGDFTFAFWIFSPTPITTYSIPLRFRNEPGGTYLQVNVNRTSGSHGILVEFYADSTLVELNYGALGLLTDGSWHHVAITRASGTVNLIIDGTNRDTDTFNKAWDLRGSYRICGAYDDGSYSLSGYIDELIISHAALTIAPGGPAAAHEMLWVSADFGANSFAPASLKVTIDGVERDATVPADLVAMDAAITLDYSTNAAGADGATGYTGSAVTPTVFSGLSSSLFSGVTHLFLKINSLSDQLITNAELDTSSYATTISKTANIISTKDAVQNVSINANGSITSLGSISCSNEIIARTGISVVGSEAGIYFGDSDQDDSWRTVVVSNEFLTQERVGGNWVTEDTLPSP